MITGLSSCFSGGWLGYIPICPALSLYLCLGSLPSLSCLAIGQISFILKQEVEYIFTPAEVLALSTISCQDIEERLSFGFVISVNDLKLQSIMCAPSSLQKR